MYENEGSQPLLTSHEASLRRVGPARGKQRFEVTRPDRTSGDQSRGSRERQFAPKPRSQKHHSKPAPKPQGFNHDAMLTAYRGSKVEIMMLNGSLIECVVRDADRYTLVIQDGDDRLLIYKHAIAGIKFPKVQ